VRSTPPPLPHLLTAPFTHLYMPCVHVSEVHIAPCELVSCFPVVQ
jgi:hypothetical protein